MKSAVDKTIAKLKRRVARAYDDAIVELSVEGVDMPITVALLIAHGEVARIAGETMNMIVAANAKRRSAAEEQKCEGGVDKDSSG